MERPDIKGLKTKAREIRKTILKMLAEASSGHTGGSLSIVEIILSLYCYKKNILSTGGSEALLVKSCLRTIPPPLR